MAALDPASIESQEEVEDSIDRAAVAAQMGVLAVICRRLKNVKPGDTYKDAAIWAIDDVKEMGAALSLGASAVYAAAAAAIDSMTAGNAEWAADYYAASGRQAADVSQIAAAAKEQARKQLGVLMRVPVVGLVDGYGSYAPLPQAYQGIIDRAVAAIKLGDETYTREISRAVDQLARSGVRVRYETGTTRELFGAVRTSIMDGYRDAMAEQRLAHGQAFGSDGVEVSAHGTCAPDHIAYQGMRYSDAEWRAKQFEPSRPLVVGANCRHTVSPVIIGIGNPAYSAEDLAELRELSEGEVTFTGASGKDITCTRYEATQHQRTMELAIRKKRSDASLKEMAGLDEEAADLRAQADRMTTHYRAASRQMGLSTRMERTRAYLLAK